MSYTLITTSRFERNARRFYRSHPELGSRVARILHDLAVDPFQPHLRLHPLKGRLGGMHAVNITHSYRVILTLKITEREIILLDIGSHDDVDR